VCAARVVVIGDLQNVTDVSQNHLTGRSNEDVQGIVIENQALRFAPRNLNQFFPNLEAFDIYRSQIEVITKEDLENFSNLTQLNLPGNRIQSLAGNLLEGNPLLSAISFSENPIQHVDYKVFDHLEDLNTLSFMSTSCTSMFHMNNRGGVLHLMFMLLVSCPPSFAMTESKILNGVGFQKTIDEQVADRMNPLTWNIFEMNQKLEDHDDRIAHLENELQRVSKLLEEALSAKTQ
jgi:Leucine rich repeat